MSSLAAQFQTHTVDNQPPPFESRNAWLDDLPLREAVQREGASEWQARLDAYGALSGGELARLGYEANRQRPQLKAFDRYGQRVDQVEFHPAYHQILGSALRHGVHALAWAEPRPGAQVARAALSYLHHQAEAGTSCPLTMTYAAVPELRQAPREAGDWLAKAIAFAYDDADRPMSEKLAVMLGMGMTEKQGGSDVRANTTRAHPLGGSEYELVGHKWFFSAPMCDAFLVLAQAPGGLSCFLLPRWRPDGSRNALRLMRLKDKLGNWANASSEVEFQGAFAWRVGDEGRGVATILEMVALTRLDCLLGSAAEMRRALCEAMHHARHRRAFGHRLIEQPLMRNVLADLALESEAAITFAMRVAAAIDRGAHDPGEAAFARVATAIGKYWICKRAPTFINEAQECLGGAGYVEENILPRLYREAPLNSIWEGCGNIQCLDVLRALSREPGCSEAIAAELAPHRELAAEADALHRALADPATLELNARRIVERLALSLQAATLQRAGHDAVASGFLRSRIRGERGLAFGTLPADLDIAPLLRRVLPD